MPRALIRRLRVRHTDGEVLPGEGGQRPGRDWTASRRGLVLQARRHMPSPALPGAERLSTIRGILNPERCQPAIWGTSGVTARRLPGEPPRTSPNANEP